MTNRFQNAKQTNNYSDVNDATSVNYEYTDIGLLDQITHCEQPDLETDTNSSTIHHMNSGLLDIVIKSDK